MTGRGMYHANDARMQARTTDVAQNHCMHGLRNSHVALVPGFRVRLAITSSLSLSRPALIPVQFFFSRSAGATTARTDMSVILVTGSHDHEINFWEAWSGICSRTICRAAESGVRHPFIMCVPSIPFTSLLCRVPTASQPFSDIP